MKDKIIKAFNLDAKTFLNKEELVELRTGLSRYDFDSITRLLPMVLIDCLEEKDNREDIDFPIRYLDGYCVEEDDEEECKDLMKRKDELFAQFNPE